MISLMNDTRVVFLIWFVFAAVVVASILIFIEIRTKRKMEAKATKRREKTPIDRMKIVLSKAGDVKNKLDVVGKTAKNYFKEEYGLSLKSDYSELARDFEKMGKSLEVEFCEGMFELYYSGKDLTEKRVEDLGEMLYEICRKKKIAKDISNVPSFWDRIDRVLFGIKDFVGKKIDEYTVARREKLERKARVVERQDHELVSWVRKAIRMGHDKMKVFNLLSDGKRSKRDVKKVLKVYEKEAKVIEKQLNNKVTMAGGGSGVAQRIIQKEKDRIEGAMV